MTAVAYPVVAFDLDGTLLRSTSVSLHLADWMGRRPAIEVLERQFRAHEISNGQVADVSASWFAGVTQAAVWDALRDAPWITGLAETMRALRAAGCHLLLATVTWRFAAEMLVADHGFEAVSGTEMGLEDGRLSGRVSRYFDEHDKVRFVDEWCAAGGYSMDQVAAVGDSRSDVPLFERAGCAIALNATADARRIADHVLQSDDLRDVLPFLIRAAPGNESDAGRAVPGRRRWNATG